MVRGIILLFTAFSVLLATESRCLGTSQAKLSTKQIGPLHIEQFAVYNAVGEISQKAGVPIGIDAILPNKDVTINFDFPGGTVAELLDALVVRAPDYGWEESRNRIIHVFRKSAQVSVLDVVMSYPGVERKTGLEIWTDLAHRPEISQWLKSNKCVRQEFLAGHEFASNRGSISIPAGTLTVRQLFDAVAVESGSNRWLALESGPSTPNCHVALMLW